MQNMDRKPHLYPICKAKSLSNFVVFFCILEINMMKYKSI